MTSPTWIRPSVMRKKPAMTSRIRLWAPRPTARPTAPALARIAVASTFNSRKTMTRAMKYTTYFTRLSRSGCSVRRGLSRFGSVVFPHVGGSGDEVQGGVTQLPRQVGESGPLQRLHEQVIDIDPDRPPPHLGGVERGIAAGHAGDRKARPKGLRIREMIDQSLGDGRRQAAGPQREQVERGEHLHAAMPLVGRPHGPNQPSLRIIEMLDHPRDQVVGAGAESHSVLGFPESLGHP